MADPVRAVRALLRRQATAKQRTVLVHGKIARLGKDAFLRTFEPAILSCITIRPGWRVFCLPNDPVGELDLFPVLFRISRSIGGAWAEVQHSDAEIRQTAMEWANHTHIHHRLCSLCLQGTGDTRHVILTCRYTQPYREHLSNMMERLLASQASLETHLAASSAYRTNNERIIPSFLSSDPVATRWPILTAWGWLVTNVHHEARLRVNSTDSFTQGGQRDRQ